MAKKLPYLIGFVAKKGSIRKRITASQESIDQLKFLESAVERHNKSGKPKVKLSFDEALADSFESLVKKATAEYEDYMQNESNCNIVSKP